MNFKWFLGEFRWLRPWKLVYCSGSHTTLIALLFTFNLHFYCILFCAFIIGFCGFITRLILWRHQRSKGHMQINEVKIYQYQAKAKLSVFKSACCIIQEIKPINWLCVCLLYCASISQYRYKCHCHWNQFWPYCFHPLPHYPILCVFNLDSRISTSCFGSTSPEVHFVPSS